MRNTKSTSSDRIVCVLGQPGRYEIVLRTQPSPAPSVPILANHIPISRPTYEQILAAMSSRPPESGGVLVGPKDNRLVTHFLFDADAQTTSTTYTFDHRHLNQRLSPMLDCDLDVKGFVHSHPSGVPTPSEGDRRYLQQVLDNPKNRETELFFPIFCDGRLHAYIVTRSSLNIHQQWAIPANIVLI